MKVFGSDMGEIFPQHAQQLDPAGEHRLVGRIVGADPADIFVHDLFEALKRSEEHTSELQSLMRISYAVVCLKKNKNINNLIHLLNSLYNHIPLMIHIQ